MGGIQVISESERLYECLDYSVQGGRYVRVHKVRYMQSGRYVVGVQGSDSYVDGASYVDAMRRHFGYVNLSDSGVMLPSFPHQFGGEDLFAVSMTAQGLVLENRMLNDTKRFVVMLLIPISPRVSDARVWYGYYDSYGGTRAGQRTWRKMNIVVMLSGKITDVMNGSYKPYNALRNFEVAADGVRLLSDSVPYEYKELREVLLG